MKIAGIQMVNNAFAKTLGSALLSLLVVLAVVSTGTAVGQEGADGNGENDESERSCGDLVVAALRQIMGDDVDFERGRRDGDEAIRVGNVDVICKDDIEGAVGKTFPRSDGRTDVWIDEEAIDDDLGVMKMVLFHELEHVRLVRADDGRRFGYKNPRTGTVLGDLLVDGRLEEADSRWRRNVAPCHEAVTHLKSLKYAQSLEEEFPELDESDHFWRSIDTMLESLQVCMRSEMLETRLWSGVDDNLRGELAEDIDVLVEKLLMKARRDGGVSEQEAELSFRIAKWADSDFDKDRFREIYREVALVDGGRSDGYLASAGDLPPRVAGEIRNERVLIEVESDAVLSGAPVRYGIEVDGDAVRLVEPPADPTLTVTVDERTFSSVRNSAAPEYAIRRAIKTGAVRIEGDSPLVGIGYRVVRFSTSVPPVPSRISLAGSRAPVRRNTLGVRYVVTQRQGVVMLNDYLAPTGYSSRGTQRLIAYRPNQLSRNSGVYAESVRGLRLGVM